MTPPPELKSDKSHFEDVDNTVEWNSLFRHASKWLYSNSKIEMIKERLMIEDSTTMDGIIEKKDGVGSTINIMNTKPPFDDINTTDVANKEDDLDEFYDSLSLPPGASIYKREITTTIATNTNKYKYKY